VAFYQAAFGATVLHRVGEGEDIVAQLAIGGAGFWVSTADPRTPARLAGYSSKTSSSAPRKSPSATAS
jgi:PhnB protein